MPQIMQAAWRVPLVGGPTEQPQLRVKPPQHNPLYPPAHKQHTQHTHQPHHLTHHSAPCHTHPHTSSHPAPHLAFPSCRVAPQAAARAHEPHHHVATALVHAHRERVRPSRSHHVPHQHRRVRPAVVMCHGCCVACELDVWVAAGGAPGLGDGTWWGGGGCGRLQGGVTMFPLRRPQ